MTLTLTLTNPDILPDTHRTHKVEFGEKGGVLGRNANCTWCLEDPERFVSSRHAVVVCESGSYFIEDVSTNGTYLNDALIGKGKRRPITTGDTLRVGRFVIQAQERGKDGSVKGEQPAGQDPFDMDTTKSTGSAPDLLASTHIGSGGIDDFLGSDKLGPLTPSQSSDSLIPKSGTQRASTPDHAPGINDALAPTLPTDTGDHAIPEDWWKRGPENEAKPVIPDPNPKPVPSTPLDDPLGLSVKAAPPSSELDPGNIKPEDLPPPREGLLADSGEKKELKIEAKPEVPEPKSESTPKPAPSPKRPVKDVPVSARSKPGEQDFAVDFLLALEADPSTINPDSPEILGGVMKILLAGMLDLIAARGAMRNELRLSATMIGARENNPLKFSINHKDALNRLLNGESAGFKAPIPATQEVMGDLKDHQFATLAGIDAGIKALLDATNPDKISATKGPLAGVTGMKELKTKHAALRKETQERSDGTFWRAFGKAYDQAIDVSRKNRSKSS